MKRIKSTIQVFFLILFLMLFKTVSVCAETQYVFSYTGDYQEFIAPETGYYKLEAWGAAGGKNMADGAYTSTTYVKAGGLGAYTSGEAFLEKGSKIYVYVGGKGTDGKAKTIVSGGWNGGGNGDHDHSDDEASGAGGGATDFRLISGAWDDFNSLKSRIMVAAGGGGATYKVTGGYGGALTGQNTTGSFGGSQTSGYAFGKGMDGAFKYSNVDVPGAGSGYYGGYSNPYSSYGVAAGAGGSSFVSGCTGCDAISENSTSDNIIHTGQAKHYSGFVFTNISMIAGNASMPKYDGTGNMTGNSSNGYARITFLGTTSYITNISVNDSLVIKDESKLLSYIIYLEKDAPKVGDLNLEFSEQPASVIGDKNVSFTPETTHTVIVTGTSGKVITYNIYFKEEHSRLLSLNFDYLKFPNFDGDIFEYSGTVPYNIKRLEPIIEVDDDTVYVVNGNDDLQVGENTITILVTKAGYDVKTYTVKVTREDYNKSSSEKAYDFSYTGNVQTFIVPETGFYTMEAWGAGGGTSLAQNSLTNTSSRPGGAGAYTKGQIYLEEGDTLYIYVGGRGSDGKYRTVVSGGWNGGGSGEHDHSDDEAAGGGGGASDIRLVNGAWNDFNSLKSRIMVAAGGGGAAYEGSGGYGGSLTGGDTTYSNGATQTTGNAFGVGANGKYTVSNTEVGGGGGGYYGGNAVSGPASTWKASGSGGSSFVSGCTGCNAIAETSTSSNIIHTGQSKHYSGYVFTDIEMYAGNAYMPDYNSNNRMVGNSENGYVRITYTKGLPQLIDLEVDGGRVIEPITAEEYNYQILIPEDNFKTTLTATTLWEGIVLGDGEVTLTVGKVHKIVLMDEVGNIAVYNFTPVLDRANAIDISFEGISYDFRSSTYEYNLDVPNDMKVLVPKVIVPQDSSYEIQGDLDLSVGENIIVVIAIKDASGVETKYKYNINREFNVSNKANMDFAYTGNYQTFVAPADGIYRLEAWGASGGRNRAQNSFTDSYSNLGGAGAYTKGEIYLTQGTTLYVYVGGMGSDAIAYQVVPGGWNGGGTGDHDHADNEASAGGGGATDFRLVSGAWNDFNSLKSRIMVAGAGGGASYGLNSTGVAKGGYGGALAGQDTKYSKGGTQTTGYAFGRGMDGKYVNSNVDVAGGGSGYYGGYANSSGKANTYEAAGAGGSSFVSGCTGCNAISESSTSSNIIHTGQPNHYSGYVFNNIQMIAGNASMPSYTSNGNMTGNTQADGYARITFLSTIDTKLETLEVKDSDGNVIPLSPTFNSSTKEYTVDLTHEQIHISINAKSDSKDALVTGTGEFDIPAGETVKTVTLTDEIGNVTTYTITFNRDLNADKYLKDILINGISVTEYGATFNPTTDTYEVEVPFMLEYVLITGVKNNPFQTVLNDGIYVFDDNELYKEIVCVAEAPGYNQNYKITIKRQKTSLLKGLSVLTPGVNDIKFNQKTFTYELELYNDIYELDLDAIPYYKGANITIDGNKFVKDKITILSHVDGVEDTLYTLNIKRTDTAELDKDFGLTGEPEAFVVPYSGYYRVSLWGAAGGQGMTNKVLKYMGGEGAYTSGTILLKAGDVLYLNIGGKGNASGTNGLYDGALGGYNGGGNGGNDTDRDSTPEPGSGGGGATDIRVLDGTWNSTSSLRSRLMVAAGASGGSYYAVGAAAGGLIGYKPSNNSNLANQIAGSNYGLGANGVNGTGGASGAGGGYYGGYSANTSAGYSSGSGSSYISGHAGSIGTKEDGTMNATSYTTLEDSVNYSGLYFTDTIMIDGSGYLWTTKKERLELMPNPAGGYFGSGRGNPGDGAANIKLLNTVSSNNYLESLTLTSKNGEKDINFEPWILEYDVYLDVDESELDVAAKLMDENAEITGIGKVTVAPSIVEDDGTLSSPYQILVTVTSTDGSIRVYTINAYRYPSDSPYPEDIIIKGMPSYLCSIDSSYCNYNFEKEQENYEITVPFAVKTLDLEVKLASSFQTVTFYRIDEQGDYEYIGYYDYEVNQGCAEDQDVCEVDETILKIPKIPVELFSGSNEFIISIDAENPEYSIDYTYEIIRDPLGNNNVTDIRIVDPLIEDYGFDPLVYEYTVQVDATTIEALFEVDTELPEAEVIITGNKNLTRGMNACYITVKAPNGESITYIYHLYKEVDPNVYLQELSVKNGTTTYDLTPIYDKYINDYTVSIPGDVKTIDITAIPEVSTAKVTIDGQELTDGKLNVSLISGVSQIQVLVESGAGESNIYYINVIKQKNSNANLANIEVKGYVLEELKDGSSFDPNKTEYNVIVPKSVKKLALKTALIITPEESTTKVTVKGNTTLLNNNNTITITSVAEDKTQKIYYLYVAKDLSNNNYLDDIILSEGTLDKEFDKDTLTYNVTVSDTTDKINIKGIVADKTAKITGNGDYALETGLNKIELVVTSEMGTERIYTVNVTKSLSDNNELLRIENDQFSEVAKIDDTHYVINVQYEVKNINITGIPVHARATVSGNGNLELNTGDNITNLSVTSESGKIAVYEVKVVRDKSKNDDLAYLYALEGALNPRYKDTTIHYEMYVDYDVDKLTLFYEPEDVNASVEVINNGNFVPGDNEVIIRVTAESGNTKDYTIKVIKQEEPEEELLLKELTVSEGSLSPAFDPKTYVYYITVPNSVQEIALDGKALNENHIVGGAGTYGLDVGVNGLFISVSDAKGIRKDYQVIVTREKSSDASLESLVVKSATLIPVFDKDTTEYSVTTSNSELQFTVIKPTESEATYEILDNSDFVTGENVVTIRVTAPDGKTTKDYKIIANKSPSINNNLATLEVVGETLVPTFHKGVTIYSITVGNEVNSVLVNATPEDPKSTVTGTGIKTLKAGVNEIIVTVLNEAGTTKDYVVIITKEGNDNNYLASLVSSEGELDPEFNKEQTSYTVTVPYEVSEIELMGETEVSESTVVGFDTYSLNVGTNTIKINVTSEQGTVRTYTVEVIREELSSAYLKELKVEGYTLDPTFDSEYFEYYIDVPNEVTSMKDLRSNTYNPNDPQNIYVLPVPVDSKATVSIEAPDSFSIGMNEIIITVTSNDNLKTETYSLFVNRQLSTNNKLMYLTVDKGTLSPVFSPDITNYTVNVANDVEEITVNGEPENETSTIKGLGTYSLSTGENKIYVKVRSIMGIERTYTITVNKEGNSNNNLSKLQVLYNDLPLTMTPVFNPDTLKYELTVDANVKYVRIYAEAEENTSTIVGDGTKELTDEINTYEVVVTAEDNTTKTYTIVINRPKSDNNKVLNIVPSVGELKPEFNPDTKVYNLVVDPSDLFLSFEVLVDDSLATVTGNDSQVIPNGNSTRTIIVTAENGTTNTYTINVSKENQSDARLDSLQIADYPFEFDSDTFSYTIFVPTSKEKLLASEIKAVPIDKNAIVNLMGDLNLIVGINNIYTIEVIASDGYTTQEYKLNIVRESEFSSKIRNLIVKNGELKPKFDKYTLNYSVAIPNEETALDMIVTLEDIKASYEIIGNENLKVGENTVKVVVTGTDDLKTTYTITVTRGEVASNYLTNLEVENFSITPTFSETKLDYTLTVPNEISEVNIIATLKDPDSSVIGAGVTSLDVGENYKYVTVTSSDGVIRTYSINITREEFVSTKVRDLIVKNGELKPHFEGDITDYTIHVPYEVSKLDMIVTLESDKATYNVVGNSDFVVGSNQVQIEVLYGSKKTTYNLTVIRGEKANNYLTNLEVENYNISPVFDKETLYYTLTVPENVDKVNIIATLEDELASVIGDGEVTLNYGRNDKYVTVTSSDNVIRTYTIAITRESINDNLLLTLESDIGIINPTFEPTVNNYVLSVPNGTTEVNLSGTISNDAIVIGLGNISITGNSFNHIIMVTSKDGFVNTYTINITMGNVSTELIKLIPSVGTMDYSNDITEYEFIVSDSDSEISFDYELKDPTATITGVDLTSLKYGENEIEIVVTATNGDARIINIKVFRNKDLVAIIPDENSIIMTPTEEKDITYTFDPTDTTYTEVEFSIEDESIATVTEEGKVTALKFGNTVLTIRSKHNPDIFATVSINVLSTKITSSILDVIRDVPEDECEFDVCPDIVIGEESKVELSEFITKFDNDETYLHVFDSDDNEIDDMATYVGSRMTLKLIIDDKLYDEVIVVVRGDYDGDGKVSAVDQTWMNDLILRVITRDFVDTKIGDLDGDGKVSAVDQTMTNDYILKVISSIN